MSSEGGEDCGVMESVLGREREGRVGREREGRVGREREGRVVALVGRGRGGLWRW